MSAQTTQAETANLFLLEDLEDAGRIRGLAESDLDALGSVADWIKTYVLKPHKELIGRDGTVCPFLPGSVERKTLWLGPEQVADGGGPRVVEVMRDYKRLLVETPSTGGDGDHGQQEERHRLRRRRPAGRS